MNKNNNYTKDENDLWIKIKLGDKNSLSKLFMLYKSRLFNYGYKIFPCNDFIKDCIQELFLTIWEQRKSISHVHSVRSYLYVSMRRMVFHNLKKSRNSKNRHYQFAEQFFEQTQDIESYIVTEERKAEKKEHLNRALLILSNRQKEIIMLKYNQGLSNSEIAVLLNINRQSVYNHVSEALKELKQFVDNTASQDNTNHISA